MWNMKCIIIPAIIKTMGIVTIGLKKNLKVIPGRYSIDSVQKTAIKGTSHTIRKALQPEI
jgi:hypothetical protein